jgi:uncharacterized protein involved in exopolysaccharide biosynthesis
MAGVIFLTLALLPVRYAATGRVLLAPAHGDIGPFVVKAATFDMSVSGEPGSRVLTIEHWAPEPRAAADAVNAFLDTQLTAEMTLIDPAALPYAPIGPTRNLRLVYLVFAVFAFAGVFFLRKPRLHSADRSLVRHALRFAKSGERALLLESGGRLVLARELEAGTRLRILATFFGGSLVVARTVADPRRRTAKTVANS